MSQSSSMVVEMTFCSKLGLTDSLIDSLDDSLDDNDDAIVVYVYLYVVYYVYLCSFDSSSVS